jgi:sodium/pantothenate symporter
MSATITLLLGVMLLAAWRPPEMIIWLNLLAFGGLEAVFLWPLVLGLYWERANAKGAERDDRRRRALCHTRHV